MFDIQVSLHVYAIIIYATLRCLRRHHYRNLSDYIILLSNDDYFYRHMSPITIGNISNAPNVERDDFLPVEQLELALLVRVVGGNDIV